MQGQMSVSQMLVDEKHKKNDATELRRSAAASGFKREDGDPMVFVLADHGQGPFQRES